MCKAERSLVSFGGAAGAQGCSQMGVTGPLRWMDSVFVCNRLQSWNVTAVPSEPGMYVHRYCEGSAKSFVSWLSTLPASTLVSGKEQRQRVASFVPVPPNALSPAIQPLCPGDDKGMVCAFLLISSAAWQAPCSVCLTPQPGAVF